MTTQTLVPKARIALQEFPKPRLVTWLAEHVLQLPWPHQRGIDPVLARAIEEAFESLARETRS